MNFWDLIPVNKDADMSLWSAFVFMIGATASGVYSKYIQGCKSTMEKRLDNHDELFRIYGERLAGIEATSQNTLAIVEKLDKRLSDEAKVYQSALLKSIRKQ